MVSRKWITTLVAAEESSTQVEVALTAALDSEDLSDAAANWASPELQAALAARDHDALAELTTAGQIPLLLAVGDNGPQMRTYTTREFMAALAIAQQFGRPSTRRAGQTVGGGYSPRGGPTVGSARIWAMPDTRPSAPVPSVYQLRVVVRGVSPLIWRRLLIPADTTIAGLHAVLQIAFGWNGDHLGTRA